MKDHLLLIAIGSLLARSTAIGYPVACIRNDHHRTLIIPTAAPDQPIPRGLFWEEPTPTGPYLGGFPTSTTLSLSDHMEITEQDHAMREEISKRILAIVPETPDFLGDQSAKDRLGHEKAMQASLSYRRRKFYETCTPYGQPFTTEDKTSIPSIPLKAQPLTHGLVHLTAYFATAADGTEHIHAFQINPVPLIPESDAQQYQQQATALAKTIDSIN